MIRLKKFGLIGYPLGHSMSPFIHEKLFSLNGVDAKYSLFEISPAELEKNISALKELDGFNVTIPHKTGIIRSLDYLSERAKLFGAVNTVKCGEITKGYNTDCHGFLRALDCAQISLSGDVLVCGAGGAGRMFIFESVLAGADVTVAVRNPDKAIELKNEIRNKLGKDIIIISLSEIAEGYDLVINSTPVGMSPDTGNSVLSLEQVKKCGAVFDAIYNPLETKLLSFAKKAGIKHSNGLSMLVWQAAVAQEIWFDASFEKSDVERIIAKTQEELSK